MKTLLLLLSSLVSSALAVRNLQIASPLQTLTIFDPEVDTTTHRQRFLPRFKAGMNAEQNTFKPHKADVSRDDWVKQATTTERRNEKVLEKAYDEAVAKYEQLQQQVKKSQAHNANIYQFVGVIKKNKNNTKESPITWYARKKPASAKWSVRLVHANRAAILKDLFQRGKIDIMASYQNTKQRDEVTNQQIVNVKYSVKERSWKTLWNFSPKHFFTDSSGKYWRERRLPEGLYTDGNTVYEASYLYRKGRNGMHRVSSLTQLINSKNVNPKYKHHIVKRLKDDVPDVVLE